MGGWGFGLRDGSAVVERRGFFFWSERRFDGGDSAREIMAGGTLRLMFALGCFSGGSVARLAKECFWVDTEEPSVFTAGLGPETGPGAGARS